MRAINDQKRYRIFCLVHAEKLSYEVSDLALSSLSYRSEGEKGEYHGIFVSIWRPAIQAFRALLLEGSKHCE
jgi:hypothetical protein